LPADLPEEKPEKEEDQEGEGGAGVHGKDRGHGSRGLDRPHDQRPQMGGSPQEAVYRLEQAGGQEDDRADRVQQVGAEQGEERPAGGPQDGLFECQETLGQGMTDQDGIQVVFGAAESPLRQLSPVDTRVHQVVQGIDGGISGKDGDQAQKDDPQRRDGAVPEQGGKRGRGHVQQAVGGARKGEKELQPQQG